jgi:CBS domain-containing protein
MFGGVAFLDRDSDSPSTEFKIAIAGPIVTAVIVLLCAGAGLLLAGPDDFAAATALDSDAEVSGLAALIAWLSSINLLVLVFNLVPAFPLDGGRIARAVAWWRTGSRNSGTRFAATLGQGFGLFLILVGLGYFMAYLGDFVGGIWLAFLGFILRGAARGAIAQTELTSRIEGVSVADVMDPEPVAIPEELSVERALDEYFLRYRWPWFPVTDLRGRFLGLVRRDNVEAVPEALRPGSSVDEVVDRGAASDFRVGIDEPLDALLGSEGLRRLGALVAVDDEGVVRGVITLDQVRRALRPAT